MPPATTPPGSSTSARRAASAALLTALACGTAEPAAEGSGSVPDVATLDSAGVEIVNVGPDTLLLPVVETLRLGTIDGRGPEQFVRVGVVALGAGGRIYVGDGGSASARVFDADGRFVRELAGRGQGPSEVIMVNDLLVSGDTVAVVDWQANGKVVRFDGEGAFLDSSPVLRPDMTTVVPQHAGPTGWLASVDRMRRPPLLGPGEAWTTTVTIHSVDYGAGGEVGPERYRFPGSTLYGTGGGGEGGVDWGLFRTRSATGFDALGRLYLTDRASYRIDVFDASGLVRSIRRETTARTITGADVDALRAAALGAVDTTTLWPGADRAAQRSQLEERIDGQARLPRPEVATPLGQLLVSPDGSFWVEVLSGASLVETEVEQMFGGFSKVPRSRTTWDLFDPSGAYLGTAVLPPRFRAESVSGATVVGVQADDLDVESVVRFEVQGLD